MSAELAFKQSRRLGVGGSDIAKIFGMSGYGTPLTVWQEKMGFSEIVPETNAQRLGKLLEPVLRGMYETRTGHKVMTFDPLKPLTHANDNFMRANLDGAVLLPDDTYKGVEFKTARYSAGWGEEGTNDIPFDYMLQVQFYMLVTGWSSFDVYVLIGGQDDRLYHVPADLDLQSIIKEGVTRFWKMVTSNTVPDASNSYELGKLFANEKSMRVVASLEDYEKVMTLAHLRKSIKDLTAQKEAVEFEIKKLMLDSDTLTFNMEAIATWKKAKNSKARKLDMDALWRDHADLLEDYIVQREATRMLRIHVDVLDADEEETQ